jgi:hypothetical protein
MPRNRRNNKKKKSKRNRNRTAKGGSYRVTLTNRNQMSMPDSIVVDLAWTEINKAYDPGTVLFGIFRYRGNDVFDPDPISGGESAYNFNDWAALYRRFRVISIKVQATIVNNEAFPVFVTSAPSDTDIASSVSDSEAVLDIGEMPYATRVKLLSPVGGMDRVNINKTIHWPKFIGNKATYMADVTYSALVTTNPQTILYYNFGITANSNFVNGVTRFVRIIYRVLFNDRNFDIPVTMKEDRNYKKMKQGIKPLEYQ